MDKNQPDLACQLCGANGLEKFEIAGSNLLWKCNSCELFQYGQLVDPEAYSADYHSGYEKHRPKKIRTARVRLNRVASLIPEPSNGKPTLLDIGCSVGATLEAAGHFGWHAVGVDISRDAVEYCQGKGLNALTVNELKLPFDDNQFDVVVNWHVIEHVPDVRATLAEWQRVLKPGGILFMETPDASSPKVRKLGTRYRKFWAPEHTYTFTHQNLACFLEEAGMEVVTGSWVGPLRNHGIFAPYAISYRTFHGIRKWAGVHKEFQIFARKPAIQSSTGSGDNDLKKVACAA